MSDLYNDQTYEAILNRMLARIPDEYDKRESSLIWDTQASTANEILLLYVELKTLIANSYGDTAEREFLIYLCGDRGIIPESATNAILKGEFTPTNIDVTGQRFNIGEMNYTVIAPIDGEAGSYTVQCEEVGTIGNQYLGDIIPMNYIDGLETAELTEVLIPGEDEETTDHLRQRYLDSFNEKAFAGNKAAYLALVRAIDGVGDVKVTRVWNGDINPASMIPTDAVTTWYNGLSVTGEVKAWIDAVYAAALAKKLTVGGTVLITIVDSDDYGVASSTLVQTVQNAIDPESDAGEGEGLAPIGHVVTVQSASGVTINVTTDITFEQGYSWSNLGTAITKAVSDYLLELRTYWANGSNTVVRIAQIESRILAITGVADIADTEINGEASNLTLGEYEIPVMGGVSP